MKNPASKIMYQVVTTVAEKANQAQSEFDFEAERVQQKAKSSIDLFGGTAVNQVADISSETRKASDALYASLQMLVQMLDEQCRPLLDQNPEPSAVLAVKELIVKLNDDSEIENNFSLSLNHQDLGGVATRRYFPSIENKMIQKYWENVFSEMPGNEKAYADYLNRQKQELIAAREEERQAKLQEQEWEREEQKRIKNKREETANNFRTIKTKVDETIENYRGSKLLSATNRCNLILNDQKRIIDECSAKISESQQKLNKLGFFKFSEKAAIKAVIRDLKLQTEMAKERISAAETENKIAKESIEQELITQRDSIILEIIREYSVVPSYVEKERAIQLYAIYELILEHGEVTVSQIMELCPKFHKYTNQQISAIIRRMIADNLLQRYERDRKAFFDFPID